MSLITIIYLADVVNGLQTILGMLGIMLGIVSIGFFGYIHDINRFTDSKTTHKLPIIGLICSVLMLFLTSFIPSKETIYMMTAVHYGQELAKTPQVNELSSKVYTILNSKLDEMMPKKEEKGK